MLSFFPFLVKPQRSHIVFFVSSHFHWNIIRPGLQLEPPVCAVSPGRSACPPAVWPVPRRSVHSGSLQVFLRLPSGPRLHLQHCAWASEIQGEGLETWSLKIERNLNNWHMLGCQRIQWNDSLCDTERPLNGKTKATQSCRLHRIMLSSLWLHFITFKCECKTLWMQPYPFLFWLKSHQAQSHSASVTLLHLPLHLLLHIWQPAMDPVHPPESPVSPLEAAGGGSLLHPNHPESGYAPSSSEKQQDE